MPGVAGVRVWINEGRLAVGDDMVYALVAGDVRTNVLPAWTNLVKTMRERVYAKRENPRMSEPLAVPVESVAGERAPWFTRGVRSIGLASFLADLGHEIPTSLLPSFLTATLGAPAAALGLIEGFADGFAGVARLAGGALSDDPHRRRQVALGGYGATAVLSAAIGLCATVPQVAVLRGRELARARHPRPGAQRPARRRRAGQRLRARLRLRARHGQPRRRLRAGAGAAARLPRLGARRHPAQRDPRAARHAGDPDRDPLDAEAEPPRAPGDPPARAPGAPGTARAPHVSGSPPSSSPTSPPPCSSCARPNS